MRKKSQDRPDYRTITGGSIPLSKLSDAEYDFLDLVAKKYTARQDWTRFAAWWNAEFKATDLSTDSVVYRICQDLEARLGIKQGKVSPPDYRDYLIELIDVHYGSRQEFCKAAEIDPGQLSRVMAGRADLSMKVLQQALELLHARLVIQVENEAKEHTNIEEAKKAIQTALASRKGGESPHPNEALPLHA